ncbi:MAG TPA: hypothetical protein VGB92_18150 [Longimicrobium sp.]|jgi:hypothetical protein
MSNSQKIRELTTQLNEVVSHPEFIGLLEQLEKEPDTDRKQFVRDRMNVNALRGKGIPVRPELRSVVRVFEDPKAAVISPAAVDLGDATARNVDALAPGDVTVCTSVGIVVCVSMGSTVS